MREGERGEERRIGERGGEKDRREGEGDGEGERERG